jgi:O-antigen/teichoic acid export membrane protein
MSDVEIAVWAFVISAVVSLLVSGVLWSVMKK